MEDNTSKIKEASRRFLDYSSMHLHKSHDVDDDESPIKAEPELKKFKTFFDCKFNNGKDLTSKFFEGDFDD